MTDANGNSLVPYAFDGSVTFTAKFLSTKCTLFFESNGGSSVDSVEVDYGTPYTITETPTREGFFFGGWFDESLVNEYIGTITLTNNAVVYAKWIKSVEIYDVDGLKAIADNPYGNYHLTTNINLRGEVWTPIDIFTGILNGNGYKIYNFALKKDNADLGFIIKNQGTIKNLNLSNIEVSSTVNSVWCSLSAFCAYNEGSLVNVAIESVNAIVNVSSTNVNNEVSVGMLTGENSGKIISCTMNSKLILNADLQSDNSYGGYYTTVLRVGGLCGKNTGSIFDVRLKLNAKIDEYVKGNGYYSTSCKKSDFNMGGVCGAEFGNLANVVSDFTCAFSSNGGYDADGRPDRYTYIGGVVGRVLEGGAVSNCYSYGTADLARVGNYIESFESYSGGIVGKVENGTVNNCASKVDLTLTEGYFSDIAGIAGCVDQNGRVSNVAYYGTIKTLADSNGYLAGLVGLVNGVFTKAYFHGKVDTVSAKAADVAGKISSSGSVSKTIDNGNKRVVLVENSGAANDNYVIGVDYGADVLLDINTLFETLCLYEADIWSVDEEIGLYLISFPEYDLPTLD